jgi:TPR repeat protein
MSHFTEIQEVVAVASGVFALAAAWSWFSKEDESRAPDGMDQGPVPDRDNSNWQRVLPAAAAIFVGLTLCYVGYTYLSPYFARQHAIALYPGKYRRIVLSSGATVSMAMKAVYAASDTNAQSAAIATLEKMVDAGDAEAAFRLGRYYHLESAEPNYTLALKYYEIASNENHAWATNNLGLMYRDGLGVTTDDRKAHEYFQTASRQHNSWSYLNLADMSFEGFDGPADANQGIAWLEEGRQIGCTLCLIEEAAIYHSGAYGIDADRDKAVWLLNKAAALGDSQAKLIVAELYIVGDGVPQSSSKAFEILKELSDTGDGSASTLLGELSADDKIRNYLFATAMGGAGQIPSDLTEAFPQNTATAMRYWERANQQGSCQSWIDLSAVYDKGIDVGGDAERAADYIERAVRCDPTNSFYLWKLAMRFFDAQGRAHDCEKAAKFLNQSLVHGYADASVNLGYIYDKGCPPIASDFPRAFQIYLLGAKRGVALSQNNVGVMIKHGRGVPADLARGYAWITVAALNGDKLAKNNLQDPVYTAKVRAAGLVDLAEIQLRLATVPEDPQAILRDPWY